MAVTDDDPLVGTLVAGRYRIGRKLGEGGMGLVYLAVHEALRKPVALKVLSKAGRVDAEAVARFEREAIAAANLKHPHIAEATDFGQLPDGGLYLVMEHVDGITLRQLLAEQGKLTPERALTILQQVAAALATAHARDVVHRDLKPDNVIVAHAPEPGETGATDSVKVIDFGIAKLRSATFGGGGTNLTRAGTVIGTPEYMSPEQVMGQAVDAQSDQYALGVLAFELFTGRPPYKADDVSQLMMMHVGAPVPSTREHAPLLPAEVDAVTTRMLAKLPEERFPSVADAMRALTTALSAQSGAQSSEAAPGNARPPVGPEIVAAPAREPIAAPTADKTLRSPGNEPAPPSGSLRSRRSLAVAIGAVTLVLGMLAVALIILSSREKTSPRAGTAPATTAVTPTPVATPTPAAPAAAPKGNAKGRGKKEH